MGRKLVVIGAVVAVGALGAVWWGQRAALAEVPLAYDAPPPPSADGASQRAEGPLDSWCAPESDWVATDSSPWLLATTATSGTSDVCVDIFRLADEDPDKDYYAAQVTGAWVTTDVSVQVPWASSSVDADPIAVSLGWGVPVADNVWSAEQYRLVPCDASDVDGQAIEETWATSSDGSGCVAWLFLPERGDVDGSTVTWTVVQPGESPATVMSIEIGVAEGVVPEFSLDVTSAASA